MKRTPGVDRRVERGVILIFVAGSLVVLAGLGMAFFTLTQASTFSAVRFMDMVRAEMLAQAGIHDAIARLREQAYDRTEDPADPWCMRNWLYDGAAKTSYPLGDGLDNDGDGIVDNETGEQLVPYARCLGSSAGESSDRYLLEVEDGSGKINLNACDNLAVVLDNLCRLIGPPLVSADPDLLQPFRWFEESSGARVDYGRNTQEKTTTYIYDSSGNVIGSFTDLTRDLYYALDADERPVRRDQAPYDTIFESMLKDADGTAVYGDGYAIAGYRGRHGPLRSLEELKNAFTFVDRNGNGIADDPLEQMEIEAKYAALSPYVTLASWIDTTTVGAGKFEWVQTPPVHAHPHTGVPAPMGTPHAEVRNPATDSVVPYEECQILIDRDKSWVADDPNNDPLNRRGSLRGSYISIMNGHGAGQLRRIATNGIDWLAIQADPSISDEQMTIVPGPISSYMIIAAEDALQQAVHNTLPVVRVPQMNADGTLVDHPNIDYSVYPLCIHRAPVNINTASDKVLAALLMGVNVQHGHFLALGTDADYQDYEDRTRTATAWYKNDLHGGEPYLLTWWGLKRIPANTGKLFNGTAPAAPAASDYRMDYLSNYGTANGTGLVNEAVELAQRIIVARQRSAAWPYYDAATNTVYPTPSIGAYQRVTFSSWDDLYFRVIKPWDDQRRANSLDVNGKYHKRLLAKMLMANFNPNNDILKYNPNIEWIDRWGRNFVDMEPVMIYTNQAEPHNGNPTVADPVLSTSIPIYSTADPVLKSSRRDSAGNFIQGAYLIRSYRYRSDDLIDKTDLNRSTTELAFHANGIFRIASTGQVVQPLTSQVFSEHRVETLVKVYDVWTESTQRQFVNGRISAAYGNRGTACSGQVARDAYNQTGRLALNTLPEPLVPFQHRIVNANSVELVTGGNAILDAYGNIRTNPIPALSSTAEGEVPDVIGNRVQPAQWDGQIVLATNTSAYDPLSTGDKDTFLATFDGDLDTADCKGNGREQAKIPNRSDGRGDKVRVVDTFSLLGLLNDTLQDMDPGLPLANPADPVNGFRWVYRFIGMNAGLKGLNASYYWNNVTARMGDLRTEGVFLSSPGVAGNDATLKYALGASPNQNFDPASSTGNDITLWFKPTWHHDDFRTHEFFNASNPGANLHYGRGCYLAKYGQYVYSFHDFQPSWGHSANRTKTNVLASFWEVEGPAGTSCDGKDWDVGAFLFGGYDNVPSTLPQKEAAGYRVQPFRWHFTGMRRRALSQMLPTAPQGDGQRGHWLQADDYNNPKTVDTVDHHIRPFIDSQLYPEGQTTWLNRQYFCFRSDDSNRPTGCIVGASGAVNTNGTAGQDVKWQWADPAGNAMTTKVFSINNLNFGNNGAVAVANNVLTHYRFMPDDGTYAVIDELKISSKDRILVDHPANPDWANDRVVREQVLSRYYLPPDAAVLDTAPSAGGPPTFTSQTLLQSRRGYDRTASSEQVSLVRVTWTVFTPRFMAEWKAPSAARYARTEYITYNGMMNPVGTPNPGRTQNAVTVAIKGPFDQKAYNDNTYVDNMAGDGSLVSRARSFISVARPTPGQYGGQAHASKGVRVQLLKDPDGITENGDEVILATFSNPDTYNVVGSAVAPVGVLTSELRYRVQFVYPVDRLVDPGGGVAVAGNYYVDVTNQYLLDTPVFDDISITFIGRKAFEIFNPIRE